jgi:hypothetical protein
MLDYNSTLGRVKKIDFFNFSCLLDRPRVGLKAEICKKTHATVPLRNMQLNEYSDILEDKATYCFSKKLGH